ncbi:MAG: histidine kinase [Bacteroidia bacterium]
MKPSLFLLFYFSLLTNAISLADSVSSAHANSAVITISEKIKEINLWSAIQVLEETNEQYLPEQVLSGKLDSLFHENEIGKTKELNQSVWARIKLKSDADKITSWILQTDKLYSDVNCYTVFPGGKVLIQHSGWSFPQSKRSVKDPDVIFNLSLAEDQSAEIYMHIQTNLRWSTFDNVKAKLISSDKWNEMKWRKNFFFGLCAGICMLAMFYWLINYFYSSHDNYLYLIAATLSTLIFYLDNYGILTSLFWHDSTWYLLSKYGQTFLWFPFMGISGFVLAAKLNHFKENFPRLVFLFFAYALMTTLFCVISPFFFSWQFSHYITLVLYLAGTWLPASMLLYLWLKNQSTAPGFALLSYLPWIIGFNFFALLSFGIVPDNFLFNMIVPSGALLTVILFFYGMVNYLQALRQKREKDHVENERLIREQNTMLEQNAEQRQKEMALSLQVSETEMKALRSQMNPHFIFNALQSIQTFLLNNNSDNANLYLLKFAKLMRLVLENSQYSEVSLQLDLEALELYMQLESIRLPHPFTYTFHIDESIDMEATTIPPLILQPFVENAIWHGLQYKTERGQINIYISKKDNALFATVEDNGVGRDMSKQVQQPMLIKKESLGTKLTEERLKILNELKKIKAQFKIIDLFTKDNQAAGTRVELSLPLVA